MEAQFYDREDAGRRLVRKLERFANTDALVLALPKGGVVVAFQISKILNLDLNIYFSKKIGHPLNPEYAIGAVTESGFLEIDSSSKINKDDSRILKQKSKLLGSMKLRRALYTDGYFPNIKDRNIILVDDGIATGMTARAAIKDLRLMKPRSITLAVPVAERNVLDGLRPLVDDVAVLRSEYFFLGSVGAYYEDFPDISDEQVIETLKRRS